MFKAFIYVKNPMVSFGEKAKKKGEIWIKVVVMLVMLLQLFQDTTWDSNQ